MRLFSSTSFPQKHSPKKYYVRGQPHLSFFGAKALSSLIIKCVSSSPAFVSVLLLKSFLKSTFLIFSFYEQNAIRSDTQEIFFVQYLVDFGYKSRINTGVSWCPSKVYWVVTRCAKYFIILKKRY